MQPAPGMPRAALRAWLPVALTVGVSGAEVARTGNGAWACLAGACVGLACAVALARVYLERLAPDLARVPAPGDETAPGPGA